LGYDTRRSRVYIEGMLDKLCNHALDTIAAAPACTLSTSGPAGLQASVVACQVQDGHIFVLIPRTTDHLFNLEHQTEVVLTTERWQLRGRAKTNTPKAPHYSAIEPRQPVVVVKVIPVRMHIEAAGGSNGHRETIDFQVLDS